VCVFDYDGDSRQDIYFVQSGRLPGYAPQGPLRSALYRNAGGGRFALGRDSKENDLVLARRAPGDLVLRMTDRPGPVGVLRRPTGDDLAAAAGLVVRYGRKVSPEVPATVAAEGDQGSMTIKALPLADTVFQSWQW